MSIRYQPRKLLARIAPKRKIEKLVSNRLTLQRATLTTLNDTGVLTKPTLEKIALKVIKEYKGKYSDLRDEGLDPETAREEAIAGRKLLVQRVQQATVHEISQEIQDQYSGEYYTWLPSTANEPDPLHQLNYGKTFQLGVGEAPGDRYGCQCGMEIHVKESQLSL